MDYELAKKLKDAGFQIPFNNKGELTCKAQALAKEQGNFVSCDHQRCILSLEEIYFPTLSELIEACGDKFSQLNKWDIEKEPEGKWSAIGDIPYNESIDSVSVRQEGSTPEEAVANLWLEINKKI